MHVERENLLKICEIDQRNRSTARLTIDRPGILSLERNISETIGRPSLGDIVAPVPIFDDYNMTVSRFISFCRLKASLSSGRGQRHDLITKQIIWESKEDDVLAKIH